MKRATAAKRAPLADTGPAPLLLVTRGSVDMEQFDILCSDPRVELFTTPELTREWIGFADRVSAVLVVGQDPWNSLVYATSAAITAPIVLVMPAELKPEKKHLIEGGAAGCLLLPLDKDDVELLVGRLVRRAGQSVVSPTIRLLLDPVGLTARYRDKSVHLTHREFAMLHALSQHDGRPMSVQQVFDYVWGDKASMNGAGGNSQQVVAVWAYELRRKLKQLGLAESLVNVRGFGYALKAPEVKPKRGRGRPRKNP